MIKSAEASAVVQRPDTLTRLAPLQFTARSMKPSKPRNAHEAGCFPFKSGFVAGEGMPGGVMTQRNPTCDEPVPIAPFPRPPGM